MVGSQVGVEKTIKRFRVSNSVDVERNMQPPLVVVRSHKIGWQVPACLVRSLRRIQRSRVTESKEVARPPTMVVQPGVFHEDLIHDVDPALVAGVDATLDAWF